jgi:hypothetical protein
MMITTNNKTAAESLNMFVFTFVCLKRKRKEMTTVPDILPENKCFFANIIITRKNIYTIIKKNIIFLVIKAYFFVLYKNQCTIICNKKKKKNAGKFSARKIIPKNYTEKY